MWLPPPLLRWLPPGLLARWLEGRQPLALPLLGTAAENALWAGLAKPLQSKAAARSLKAALWAEAQAEAQQEQRQRCTGRCQQVRVVRVKAEAAP